MGLRIVSDVTDMRKIIQDDTKTLDIVENSSRSNVQSFISGIRQTVGSALSGVGNVVKPKQK